MPPAGQAERSICPDQADNASIVGMELNGTVPQPLKESPGYGHPLTRFESADFIGSGLCSFCHGNLRDGAGRNMSINDHWRSTMMANASKDPLWRAKVESETARSPHVKDTIEKKCITCHMPMAWTQLNAANATYDKQSYEDLYGRFISRNNPLHEAASDGVSCSLCHQIRDRELGTAATFSGNFPIVTGTKIPDRPVYGPYEDAVTGPMRVSVGYTPQFGIHTNDSALCGTCHTLYTPYLDEEGEVAGTFPEQTPYLEWLHSEYGEAPGRRHRIDETVGEVRLCQDCHMPHSKEGDVLIAHPSPPEAKARDHFSQHHFVGGNVLLLNIMHDNISSLSLTASPDKILATRDRTIRQLRNDTARLKLTDVGLKKNILSVNVEVESLVGHKFPTGFPSRRTWIHFKVVDAAGKPVFESGKTRPDGSIVGDDADEGMGFEPHHELIERPGQVQIYETIMEDTEDRVTYTLLRASGYKKDNRLLPRGFEKDEAGPDIAVYGAAAGDDDFVGGRDRLKYRINLGRAEAPFTVEVSLHYTTVSHAFLEDLRKDEDLQAVGRFTRYYDRADKRPVTVARDFCRIEREDI